MKTITIRDFRTRPSAVRESLASEEQTLLTANGRPFALVTPVTATNYAEVSRALQQVRAQMAVRALRGASAKSGLDQLTPDIVNAEIKASRKDQRSKLRKLKR